MDILPDAKFCPNTRAIQTGKCLLFLEENDSCSLLYTSRRKKVYLRTLTFYVSEICSFSVLLSCQTGRPKTTMAPKSYRLVRDECFKITSPSSPDDSRPPLEDGTQRRRISSGVLAQFSRQNPCRHRCQREAGPPQRCSGSSGSSQRCSSSLQTWGQTRESGSGSSYTALW